VCRAFLEETKGAARRSNLVSRLEEALGRAIHDNYGTGAIGDPSRLRDANNSFRYAPPDSLLPNVPDDQLSGEPHSFSRVFTGAFYDMLIWLLAREAKRERGVEGLERARRLAGRLLARAVETLPPGDARFAAVALRMREIDQTEEGGVASIGLEEAFAFHGMPLPALAARHRGSRRAGESARGKPSITPSTRALRALDPDRPGGAAALRAVLGVHGRARLERTTLPGRAGTGEREQFIHRDWVKVTRPSLGRRVGVWVRVICGCTLTRGPSGDVDGATVRPHPHPTERDLARQLRCWIAFDAIETGRKALRTSRQHFRERKPFRVTRDGVLERVYFE
jgi:hypothetical protein